MIGFLIGAVVLATMIFSIIQFAFLWAGQGAVETAAHFAARKFALTARADVRKAKVSALAEAVSLCRNRIGGNWESAALTSLNFALNGEDTSPVRAVAGEAYRIRLTHGVELIVPWIDRMLFFLAPVPKTRVGDKYYLFLQATRWVTVE
ncbi:MAG: hypothetical protein FIA93_04790 [Deltaproteobacteria bacterium]|nr:hypothetical protein [Deltaproteobacteria bacterium]PWB66288.1 MAG: hypothetical protein C3F14_04425 [Deltaproteobacteria bacterium]